MHKYIIRRYDQEEGVENDLGSGG